MSGAAHNLDQEYWRPPQQSSAPQAGVGTETCPRCNADLVMGARFCHVCGLEREPQPTFTGGLLTRVFGLGMAREWLHLNTGALLAFVVGLGCAAAAVITGFMYTATTVLDWQAVQIWRIEWLLGAVAAFVAGILLNRSS